MQAILSHKVWLLWHCEWLFLLWLFFFFSLVLVFFIFCCFCSSTIPMKFAVAAAPHHSPVNKSNVLMMFLPSVPTFDNKGNTRANSQQPQRQRWRQLLKALPEVDVSVIWIPLWAGYEFAHAHSLSHTHTPLSHSHALSLPFVLVHFLYDFCSDL